MPVDFSTAAKAARAQLAVPVVDVEAIRERSHAGVGARLRTRIISCAIALGILGCGAAAFASIGGGIHLWLFGNTVEATIESFAQVRAPMASDVERIVKSAPFRVMLPVGVPRDYRVVWIAYSPAEHPTLITMSYQTPSGAPGMTVTIVQTSTVERNRALLAQPAAARTATQARHFQVGAETVLVQGRQMTPTQASRVERAMRSESPQKALADLGVHLTRLLVLAPAPSVPLEVAAERLAPPNGKNMLLARWALHELPARAQNHQPLRDPRPIQFTNIPSVNGHPDYRNATVTFARPIAIGAEGVRFIESVLKSAKIGPNCGCAILVHQANGTYSIWKIDEKTLNPARLR